MPFLAFFLSPLGKYAIGAVLIIAALSGIYFKGHHDGATSVQAKWDAAVQAAIDKGNKARSDGERAIGDTPPDGLRDPNNRD